MQQKEFRKKAIAFLAKFFLIYAVLQALVLFLPISGMLEAIAAAEASWLGLQAEGNIILFGSQNFEIAENCSGLVSISVLAAIIFSLGKPEFKKKIALLAFGTAILFPLNLLRVYLVLLAAISFNPEMAETLHIATWFITSAAIIALWYFLTKRIAKVNDFSELL